MRRNSTRSAYIIIDMENGFVSPQSAHCIAGAAATIPACVKTVALAREKGIPVFFVKRLYRTDGSDVELTRYETWNQGGKACAPASAGPLSAQAPEGLKPQSGDYTIIKPRFSAFFGTELDLLLRRLDVRTVILAGATTPNCIRATCYDALSLDYNVVLLDDCCSSQTEEIQIANMGDMRRIGAVIMSSREFESYGPETVPDMLDQVRRSMEADPQPPEPFSETGEGRVQLDRW